MGCCLEMQLWLLAVIEEWLPNDSNIPNRLFTIYGISQKGMVMIVISIAFCYLFVFISIPETDSGLEKKLGLLVVAMEENSHDLDFSLEQTFFGGLQGVRFSSEPSK